MDSLVGEDLTLRPSVNLPFSGSLYRTSPGRAVFAKIFHGLPFSTRKVTRKSERLWWPCVPDFLFGR